ncbi:MAG: hypothetical protein AB7V15_06075, partial [Acidimicrobiia bacterium]
MPARRRPRLPAALLLALVLAIVAAACGGGDDDGETGGTGTEDTPAGDPVTLSIVGFAVPEAANKAIAAAWAKTPEG